MTQWTTRKVVVAFAVAGALLLPSQEVDAHGRRGGRGRAIVSVGGFYGFGPWFGFGFGPFYDWGWGPYPAAYYRPAGGVDMNVAMMAGFGAIELNAKPNRADVWVDGRYVGEARDLDGYPSYLWLPDGAHRVAVHKGGYKAFDEEVAVQRGMKTEIKVRLEPGNSPPPGTKPAEKPAEEKQKE